MTEAPIDAKRIASAARCFSADGRLQRWPSKRAEQLLVLFVVWSYLPDDQQLSEPEVNSMLRDWHDYEDYALLRRELCDLGMMRRTPNGRVYRKVAREMPAEAVALMERVGGR